SGFAVGICPAAGHVAVLIYNQAGLHRRPVIQRHLKVETSALVNGAAKVYPYRGTVVVIARSLTFFNGHVPHTQVNSRQGNDTVILTIVFECNFHNLLIVSGAGAATQG